MFPHLGKPRLPFGQAFRKYWPFMSGLVLLHFLMIFFPSVLKPDAVMITLFFGATFAAGWPWLFKDAPYTFWIVACVYWVVGLMVMALIKAVLSVLGVVP